MKALDFIAWLRCFLRDNPDVEFTKAQFAEVYTQADKVRLTNAADPVEAAAEAHVIRAKSYAGGQLLDSAFAGLLGTDYNIDDLNPSSPMPMTYGLRGYTAAVCEKIDERAAAEAAKTALAERLRCGIPTVTNLPKRGLSFKKPDFRQ